MRLWLRLLWLIPATLLLAGLAVHRSHDIRPVQSGSSQDLATGAILVATPDLSDPNFAQTVVLIVHYDEDNGAVGLILNRASDTVLSKIFPQFKSAKNDPVFEGGPVETSSAQALIRTRAKPEGASRVIAEVYASGNKDFIEKSVSAGAARSTFRLYAGYAGWGPDQLEKEVDAGGWSVLRATPDIVFDDKPETLWQRMQHDSDTRIAMSKPGERGF